MGIDVLLQTEDWETLEEVIDQKNLLYELLPSYNDYSFQFLRFIDWYGYTIFNRFQIEVFLDEWHRLYAKAKTNEEKELLAKIENLARICQTESHLYLTFQGD
jgi:hypothetical protein